MAVTMITNRGTSTATWIPHLLKRSASNGHRVKVDSRGPEVKANRDRRDHRVTRIRHAQRDHPGSRAWSKIKRCLRASPV